jgi:hypothetical protein
LRRENLIGSKTEKKVVGGPVPPAEPTVAELAKQLEEQKSRNAALAQEKEVYRTRASEMEEVARRHTAELSQSKGEIAQMGDTIQGLFRGKSSSWTGSVQIAMLAWRLNRDMDGFVAFLRGPQKNWWPYIIFGSIFAVLVIAVVELPYIEGNPLDIAAIVLIVAVLLLIGFLQSRNA